MKQDRQTSEEMLLRYAAGQLRPAAALVVASHVAMSKSSEEKLGQFEALAGVVLDEQPLADLSETLFESTLARLDEPVEEEEITGLHEHSKLKMGIAIPRPLAQRKIGPWRWMGPGMRYARVAVPEDKKINVVLLRVAAGMSLPMHGHSGSELTLVLKGSFHDESGRFVAGDLIEEDEQEDHQPKVDMDGECICLAAIEGPMRIHNWMGRLVQPFIGL